MAAQEQLLQCAKCGVHYMLTEHCTPTKCPICTSGMTIEYVTPPAFQPNYSKLK